MENGDVSLEYVSKLMNRRFSQGPMFRKILQTIWCQINEGQEIYVIGGVRQAVQQTTLRLRSESPDMAAVEGHGMAGTDVRR
ncbi:MAG TPA: hypothetical protein DIC52_05845 [Candidatus Latescibacteria bacterium]|nr:hypothetical protein [Candidatus Latescibacterota bacterium]